MRILATHHYPNVPRTVVVIAENPTEPQWAHGSTPAPPNHTGDTQEPDKTRTVLCKECRLNWRLHEFTWTGAELNMPLNSHGNPAKPGQAVTGTRPKTWDELYAEMDERLGEHVAFGDAPRKAPPPLADETPPDFELRALGDPHMSDGHPTQTYAVLRHGTQAVTFDASGDNKAAFLSDRDAKFEAAKSTILKREADNQRAAAVVN